MSIAPPPKPKAPPPQGGTAASQPTSRKLSNRVSQNVCPRLVVYAGEKFGKTTILAHAPDPVILMARGEQGYDTLLSAGMVPSVPAELVESWEETLAWLDSLIADPQGRKTVGLDAGGGFERLCAEYICHKHYKDEWGSEGFQSYNKGEGLVAGEWLKLLQRLDRLHDKHGIITVILGHAGVKAFNDPMGPTFDKYRCNMGDKVWASTAAWSDCILFGKFKTIVETSAQQARKNISERKGKGVGGTQRVIFTSPCDAYVAGNRYAMPPEISLDVEPAEMWNTIWQHIAPS